jgi:hypothetical protein
MSYLNEVLNACGFDAKQQVALSDLLKLTAVKDIPEFSGCDEALVWLVDTTQTYWLRGKGLERWDVTDEPGLTVQKAQMALDFMTLDMQAAIKPSLSDYDYVLMMGALQSRVETRLAYAKASFDAGEYDFKQLVMLGGARPLYSDKELAAQTLSEDKQTEYHMMMHVLQTMEKESKTPSEFFSKSRELINTPMQQAGDTMRRPNTKDTVESWLLTKPAPGRVLVISNQPYCRYQDAVVKSLLPSTFTVETIGHQSSGLDSTKVHLDSLARGFYTQKPQLMAVFQEQKRDEVAKEAASHFGGGFWAATDTIKNVPDSALETKLSTP